MWEQDKYGRSVIRSLPKISITPHLEVLDSHHWGKHGQVEPIQLELAWTIAFKLACKLQPAADIVEVIKVNFYQNVNCPEARIFMQVGVIVSPLHAEKKVMVDEHICVVSLGKKQEVDIDRHTGKLEKHLWEACVEKRTQFENSIGKIIELMNLLPATY